MKEEPPTSVSPRPPVGDVSSDVVNAGDAVAATGAPGDQNPPVDRLRLDQLVAREMRAAKREKDLATKLADLERKLKMAEEQEIKLGSIAQRELTIDQTNAQIAQAQKDIKRREKIVKEQEHAAAEREAKVAEREAAIRAQEEAATARELEVARREDEVKAVFAQAESMIQAAQERFVRLEQDEASLAKRIDDIQASERTIRRREQNLTEDETESARRLKDLKEREESCEKQTQALLARQQALAVKEASNQSERERLTKLSKHLDDEEKSRVKEMQQMVARREELQKLNAASEEQRAIALKEQENAAVRLAHVEERQARLDRQLADNLQLQRDLSATKIEQSTVDAELKKRERKAQQDAQALEMREAQLAKKRVELDSAEHRHREREADLAARLKQQEQREMRFAAVEAQHEKDFAALGSLEESLKRRSAALAKSEEELIHWMKEMEWRERMLGDREWVVDRIPCPIQIPTAAGGLGGFSVGSAGLGTAGAASPGGFGGLHSSSSAGGGGGGRRGNHARVSLVDRRASVAPGRQARGPSASVPRRESHAAGSAGLGASSQEIDRQAYGKAMRDMQLMRLKDQYVSSQLRWATAEVVAAGAAAGSSRNGTGGGAGRTSPESLAPRSASIVEFVPRGRRRGSIGIPSIHGTSDAALAEHQVVQTAQLEMLRRSVHRQSVEFIRTVAKLRCFDQGEPAAPESGPEAARHQQELDAFSADEYSLVAFGVNFEFLLKHVDVELSRILDTCPLDAKDQARDAVDLLQQLSVWWGSERDRLQRCLIQLLQDRQRYLSEGLSTLESKRATIPALQVNRAASNNTATAHNNNGVGGDSSNTGGSEWVPTSKPRAASPPAAGPSLPLSSPSQQQPQQQQPLPQQPIAAQILEHIQSSPVLHARSGSVVKASKLVEIQADRDRDSALNNNNSNNTPGSATFERQGSIRWGSMRKMSQTTAGGPATVLASAVADAAEEGLDILDALRSARSAGSSDASPRAASGLVLTPGRPRRDRSPPPAVEAAHSPLAGTSPRATSRVNSPGAVGGHGAAGRGGPPLDQRPVTSQSSIRGGGGAFGTLEDDTQFCLVRTGRAQSAQPKQSAVTPAALQKRPKHQFVPPAQWSLQPRTMPKIFAAMQAAAAAQAPAPSSPTSPSPEAEDTVRLPSPTTGLSTPPRLRPASRGGNGEGQRECNAIVDEIRSTDNAPMEHRPASALSPYLAPVVGKKRQHARE